MKHFQKKAPQTVKRIQELANEGFYDGLTFHRVIAGFMAQGGDPMETELEEVVKISKLSLMTSSMKRGIVSMARSNDPDSADSQFFICYDSHPFLDGQYTAWGKVIQRYESNRENS